MIVLGLHKDPWHNTGAAMIRDDGDGRRIAFVSEERLDRVKDSRAFPDRAIATCMRELGVAGLDEVDAVVLDHIETPDWRRDQTDRACRADVPLAELPARKIHVINHHLAHACAVFFSSPFDEAAVLIVDGRGSDRETQSLFAASEGRIDLVERTEAIGVGLLYAAVTQAIGFGNLQEGKTMGLAPYGHHIAGDLFDFGARYHGIVTDYGAFCTDGSYEIKAPHPPLDSFEAKSRAAWEVQNECERALLHLARHARRTTGRRNLCLSGGVGLNSVANNAILRSGLFDDIFVNPAASDTGIPLGAALWGWHILGGRSKPREGLSPFLGPSYSRQRVREAIAGFSGFRVVETKTFESALDLLVDNRIVAVCLGRSEMGPRALGNRSILMSPLRAENKDALNLRVKRREPFRPFAPAVLEELAHEWFVIDRPSPYMLLVCDVRPDKRERIPAVVHVDGTGRLQTLTRGRNAHFYDLVEGFGRRTGVPVLLNTSFNIAGEPIVETPEDAIRCFLGTSIDALLLDEALLVKE